MINQSGCYSRGRATSSNTDSCCVTGCVQKLLLRDLLVFFPEQPDGIPQPQVIVMSID